MNSKHQARPVALWVARIAIGWVVVAPQLAAGDGRLFDSNTVVIGSDGQSAVMVQSDAAIVIFERTLDLPASGGFFKRAQVWARRQDLRITSLNQQGLVFLGNERVGVFPVPGGDVGEVLFRFSEHGHTLLITKAADLPADPATEAAAGTVIDVQITRP